MFVYGFAKSERDNIERAELMQFRSLAKEVFLYDKEKINSLLKARALTEICA